MSDKYLCVANFEAQKGDIILEGGLSFSRPFSGEIEVIATITSEGEFIVEEIKRFAKASDPLDELGGVVSMAGPVDRVDYVFEGTTGRAEFEMELYYPALRGIEGNKYTFNKLDAYYPPIKTVTCTLEWQPGASILGPSLDIRLSFHFPEHDAETQGDLIGLSYEAYSKELINLSFEPIQNLEEKSWYSTGAQEERHKLRTLKLRFITMARKTPFEDDDGNRGINTIIQDWLEGANEVWSKACLTVESTGTVVPPENELLDILHIQPQQSRVIIKDVTQEEEIAQIQRQQDPNAINVYLINSFIGDRHNGGISYACGTNSAYIILDIEFEKENKNEYLLAHEIGHVLGLCHPDNVPPCEPGFDLGAPCSIMVAQVPNVANNYPVNMQVLEKPNLKMSKVLIQQKDFGDWVPDKEPKNGC